MKKPQKQQGPPQSFPTEKSTIETLCGVHSIKEALSAGRRKFEKILIGRDSLSGDVSDIRDSAAMLEIPIETVQRSRIDAISGQEVNQGIAAIVSPFPVESMESFFKKCVKKGDLPFLLILDSIVDTHNLGALIRTALCAGVNGVIIPKDRSVKPSPSVSRASAGAMEHAVIGIATNISTTIADLKSEGVWVSGLDAEAKKSVYDTDLTGPLAIVVGGEEKGIRPLVKKQCDFVVSIPQQGRVNSLNASVAGAVVMYEALRQRMKIK